MPVTWAVKQLPDAVVPKGKPRESCSAWEIDNSACLRSKGHLHPSNEVSERKKITHRKNTVLAGRMPISELGRWRLENHEFKATLGYTARPWRKRKGGRNGERRERGEGWKLESGGRGRKGSRIESESRLFERIWRVLRCPWTIAQ